MEHQDVNIDKQPFRMTTPHVAVIWRWMLNMNHQIWIVVSSVLHFGGVAQFHILLQWPVPKTKLDRCKSLCTPRLEEQQQSWCHGDFIVFNIWNLTRGREVLNLWAPSAPVSGNQVTFSDLDQDLDVPSNHENRSRQRQHGKLGKGKMGFETRNW